MNESSIRSKLTKRIVIGVLIAAALVYIVFLFITTNFLGSNNIVTETVYRETAYDVVNTTGLVVRDEEYVNATASGVLVYEVGDGDKVSAGGVIASVYKNEKDVVTLNKIAELDEKISYLESLNTVSNSVNVGIDTIDAQLNDKLTTLIRSINEHSFDTIETAEDSLMSSIYRKQLITGEQGSFDDKIAALKAERDKLSATANISSDDPITTDHSGYFVSAADGYEKCFDLDKLDEISYADYLNVKPQKINSSTCVGKVQQGVNWYLVCPVSADEAVNISRNSSSLSLRMPYALSDSIPATLVCVNQFSDEDKAIVVLQCTYMNRALSRVRKESVEIVVNSFDGLKISKKALHDDVVTYTVEEKDGSTHTERKLVRGVYIEYGNEMIFRQVDIIFSSDNYIICNEEPADGVILSGSTVKLYDKVIVEGSDLYNGKLIQ